MQGIVLWCSNATLHLLFEGQYGAIFNLLLLDLDPLWFVRNNKGQNHFHHNQNVLQKQKQKHNTINECHLALGSFNGPVITGQK